MTNLPQLQQIENWKILANHKQRRLIKQASKKIGNIVTENTLVTRTDQVRNARLERQTYKVFRSVGWAIGKKVFGLGAIFSFVLSFSSSSA